MASGKWLVGLKFVARDLIRPTVFVFPTSYSPLPTCLFPHLPLATYHSPLPYSSNLVFQHKDPRIQEFSSYDIASPTSDAAME